MNTNFGRSVKKELPFVLLFVLFVAVRIGYLLAGGVAMDSDEAIVGLMGRHILAGQYSVFFYGQEYMGSLEAYVSAFMFSLFGPSSWTLKLVPFLFAAVFFQLSVYLARSLYGLRVGLITAFLLAFSSPFFLVWSLKARGGYMETLVFGTSLVLLARSALFHASPRQSSESCTNRNRLRSIINWLLLSLAAVLGLQLATGGFSIRFGWASLSSHGLVRPLIALGACWLAGYILCKDDVIRPRALVKPFWRTMALLGFVVGLSWWTNQLVLFYCLPVACVLIWSLRSTLRVATHQFYFAVSFILFFFVGSSPYWFYKITHGFSGAGVTGMADSSVWVKQGVSFFTVAIPRFLGCWFNFAGNPVTALCSVLVLMVYACSVLFLVKRLLGQLIIGGMAQVAREGVLFLLFLCFYPVLFSISSMGWFTSEPRYLLPLFSVLPIVAAVFLSYIYGRSRSVFVLLFAPFIVLSILNASAFEISSAQPLVKNRRLPVSFAPLLDWLNTNEIRFLYSDYWVTYRLAFESGEKIISSVYPPSINDRYPAYTERVSKAEKPAYVVMETVSSGFEVMLDDLGIQQYRKKKLSPFVVYYDMEPLNRRKGIGKVLLTKENLVSLPVGSDVALTIDGNFSTRWQSQPREGEKYSAFQVDLGRIVETLHLDVFIGNFFDEIPETLLIEVSENGETWKQVRKYSNVRSELGMYEVYHPLGYWLARLRIPLEGNGLRFVRLFSPVEEGSWSIAEIEIFENVPK